MTELLIMLTREERINRALNGRKQIFVVRQMNDAIRVLNKRLPEENRIQEMSEVLFTRKKKEYMDFTEQELAILSDLLGQDITN